MKTSDLKVKLNLTDCMVENERKVKDIVTMHQVPAKCLPTDQKIFDDNMNLILPGPSVLGTYGDEVR